ncbi:MAG: hypothetical protein ABI451_03925 [Dokdonella sp.]
MSRWSTCMVAAAMLASITSCTNDATHPQSVKSSATSTATASPCANFYPAGFALAEGELSKPVTEMPEPARGVATREPSFNTCLVRATDHAADFPAAAFVRNDYSRRQAFNADNTRFVAFASDGHWLLYDANSLQMLGVLPGLVGDAEPQWHPSDPNLLYYLPPYGGTKMSALDIRTHAASVVADFTPQLPAWASAAAHIWTKDEGSASADGRYWGFQVEDGNYHLLGYIVWDLQENRLVGSMPGTERPDHVSMAPSGRWFTISGPDGGTWAWSPDFSQRKKLHHASEHSDLAINTDSHDTYVSIDYQSSGGDVFMVDIDACPAVAANVTTSAECPRTVLFPTYVDGSVTALHISGKGYDHPGWVIVSPYGTQPTRAGTLSWYGNTVFAMELKANPKVYELAHHQSVYDPNTTSYWFEPHASVSRDFTRVMFNSSWRRADEHAIDAYMVVLPRSVIR